jgi:hypothetical protein
MKLLKENRVLKAALTGAVTTVFLLSSFAWAQQGKRMTGSPANPAIDKNLLVGSFLLCNGKVTLNGNKIEAGATVLSGSDIATGSDGEAVIELADVGLVDIKSDSKVTLISLPSMVKLTTPCEKIGIRVMRGQVEVKTSGKSQTLKSDESGAFNDLIEATAAGTTNFIVGCLVSRPVGVIPWLGSAGATATGLGATSEKIKPRSSPTKP